MTALAPRDWLSPPVAARIDGVSRATAGAASDAIAARIGQLAEDNRAIH